MTRKTSHMKTRSASYNEEDGTVEIVYSIGARVERYDWMTGEEYLEGLVISEDAIVTDRLGKNAVPLLIDHNHDGLPAGRVIDHWIEGDKAVVLCKMSTRTEIKEIIGDIKAGVINTVSVGYIPYEYEVSEVAGEENVRKITKWEPTEISLVNIPADPDSQFRSLPAPAKGTVRRKIKNAITTPTKKTRSQAMPAALKKKNPTNPVPAKRAKPKGRASETAITEMEEEIDEELIGGETIEEIIGTLEETLETEIDDGEIDAEVETIVTEGAAVIEAELAELVDEIEEDEEEEAEVPADGAAAAEAARNRFSKMLDIATRCKVPTSAVAAHVKRGTKVSTFRRAAMRRMADRSTKPLSGVRGRVGVEASEKFGARAVDVLHAKMTGGKPSELARGLMDLTLYDLAKRSLGAAARGLTSKQAVISAAMQRNAFGGHTSSDFVGILSASANKTLLTGYESEPPSFDPFVKRVTLRDYKPQERHRLGDAPGFRRRAERAEVEFGTMGASKEELALFNETIGMSLSREMIVNDDLDAFGDMLTGFGVSAAEAESDMIYDLLVKEYIMADGLTVFHNKHKNLINTPLSIQGLSDARKMMMAQTSLDGRRITVRPAVLIVGGDILTEAEQLLSDTSPVTVDGVNPFNKAGLTLVSDSRIEGNQWFMSAAPTRINTLELATLEGAEGVSLETIPNHYTKSIDYIASIDIGAAPIDHRGMVKSTGNG